MILLTALLTTAVAGGGSTYFVPGDSATIQGAINLAGNGDLIIVADGTYTENLNTNGKSLTIRGSNDRGIDSVIIDADQNGSALTCANGESPTFQDITFVNGSGTSVLLGDEPNTWGGGLYCWNSSPSFVNCNFGFNSATVSGGGAYIDGALSEVDFVGCDFGFNQSEWGGGLYVENGIVNINGGVFGTNTATEAGGGMYAWTDAEIIVQNCSFENNGADAGGGYCGGYNPKFEPRSGGDVHLIRGCTFLANNALAGGGAYIAYTFTDIDQVTFGTLDIPIGGSENSSTLAGGAVYIDAASPIIRSSNFYHNESPYGGAIAALDSTPWINACNFLHNQASGDGGAINISDTGLPVSPGLISN
ncbi:MAG: DUF4988 domain-containing protein, partial [Phycisphaerales bacterium]|nr:DUF4988 domain-containing protein [Phycisphaerales bacterium]